MLGKIKMGLDTKQVYLPPGCSEEEQAVDMLGREPGGLGV